MSFPSNPTNGQQAIVNNILYTYNATKTAWIRLSNATSTITFDKLVLTNSGTDSLSLIGGITASKMNIDASASGSGNGVVINSTARSMFDNAVPVLQLIARDGSVALATTVQGNTVIGATTPSSSTTTGALVVRGGVGISGNITSGGLLVATQGAVLGSGAISNVVVAATTTSTSATTGALVVTGGVGVAGNIVVGGIVSATGNVISSGSLIAARVNNTGQFYYNSRTIAANVTIAPTENAMSVGPMTIADGVEVVIQDGGEWSIV